MGYFTWTDCITGKILGYDKKMYVICPDNSVITEESYFGYGVFGGHDINDLVAEWNRPYLDTSILEVPKNFSLLMERYKLGASDKEMKDLYASYGNLPASDWKRNIGIIIACEDDNHKLLKYPIKISRINLNGKKYEELGISFSTQ